MKLLAARAADHDDLVRLWPLCSFGLPEQAAADLHAAFPAEREDPHLAQYVADIARKAADRLDGETS